MLPTLMKTARPLAASNGKRHAQAASTINRAMGKARAA